MKKVLAIAIVDLAFGKEQFGVAENGSQQVVEIVRDPARKTPDALHLLDVRQALLEHTPFGCLVLDAQLKSLRADIREGSSSI